MNAKEWIDHLKARQGPFNGFATTLREILTLACITQLELATSAGISVPLITKVLQGRRVKVRSVTAIIAGLKQLKAGTDDVLRHLALAYVRDVYASINAPGKQTINPSDVENTRKTPRVVVRASKAALESEEFAAALHALLALHESRR